MRSDSLGGEIVVVDSFQHVEVDVAATQTFPKSVGMLLMLDRIATRGF